MRSPSISANRTALGLRRFPSAHGAVPTCGFSPALNERRPDTSGHTKEDGRNEYGGLPVNFFIFVSILHHTMIDVRCQWS